jgi:hypothetical protein
LGTEILEPAQRCSDGTTSQAAIKTTIKPAPIKLRCRVFGFACKATSCADVSAIFNFCIPDLFIN